MAQQNLRARQKQRQRMMLILLIVVLAAGGFFLFAGGGKKQAKKADNRPAPKGMVAMPVAKTNLALGTRLSSASFKTVYREPRQVPTDAVLAIDQLIGRFITRPILDSQYFKESDVGIQGAVGKYSAMAKQGHRLVVLNARMFPGSAHTLKVGDRVDVLAFEGNALQANTRRKSNYSPAISGSQPGSGGVKRSYTNNTNNQNTLSDPGTMSATLVAENAEVMSVPKLNRIGRAIDGNDYLVLQMLPQDAHVTTLMAAAGQHMQTVLRPYGDETRLTQPKPLSATTRVANAKSDPDIVHIIQNGQTFLSKPNSIMRNIEEAIEEQDNGPRILHGRKRVDVTKDASQNNASLTSNEEIIQSTDDNASGVVAYKEPVTKMHIMHVD